MIQVAQQNGSLLPQKSNQINIKKDHPCIVIVSCCTYVFPIFTGELCRSKKIFFHTDAAQAVGKVKVNVEEQKIDLLSISGHKIYAPKGIVSPSLQ